MRTAPSSASSKKYSHIMQNRTRLVKGIKRTTFHTGRETISLMEQHVARAPHHNRVLARIGQAVNVAVDSLATIGETIADDYTEIRQSMCEACKEARQAGAMIEHLCEKRDETLLSNKGFERARRHLLRSITRVLLLTDIVVVRQFLLPKEKVHHDFSRIEIVNIFTEFTKAFSHLGTEMVELNHLITGNDQKYPKNKKREAQMFVAKQVLERSAVLLHASSKTCSLHPDCVTSKENRDTVLCQMRRAMDLIHFIINDGICNSSYLKGRVSDKLELEVSELSAYSCIKHLQKLLEVNKLAMDHTCQDALVSALESVLESVQDFTDSAYTSQDHREIILENSERLKSQVHYILGFDDNPIHFEPSFNHGDLENAICLCINTTRQLVRNMSNAGALQALELNTVVQNGLELTNKIRQETLMCEIDALYHTSNAFQDSIDHILEVCKLLRHVLALETHQAFAKLTEINLRVYGPQVITASKTFVVYPGSKSAEENLDVFADMYQQLLSDVMTIVKNALKNEHDRIEPRVYTSLPRPGKHGTTSKPVKAVRIECNKPEKPAPTPEVKQIPPHELEMAETLGEENLQMQENNDILKKARSMSAMAYAMYQFTKGEGPLQTTQDLFTEAEYFAEEANRLYKNIRQFSYQIPGGDDKKEVLENLDKIPTFLQRLQFAIKDHTVGKAATFTKVDNVIQETKNLMKVIYKVTTICLACASKYKIEFRDSEGGGGRDVDSDTGASCGGSGSGDKGGGSSGQDQSL